MDICDSRVAFATENGIVLLTCDFVFKLIHLPSVDVLDHPDSIGITDRLMFTDWHRSAFIFWIRCDDASHQGQQID